MQCIQCIPLDLQLYTVYQCIPLDLQLYTVYTVYTPGLAAVYSVSVYTPGLAAVYSVSVYTPGLAAVYSVYPWTCSCIQCISVEDQPLKDMKLLVNKNTNFTYDNKPIAELYAPDGVHLSQRGKQLILGNFRHHIHGVTRDILNKPRRERERTSTRFT